MGSYDCWAINWGYRYWGEEGGAVEGLQALLRRNLNKPEHTWYYSSDSPTAIEAMANLGTLGRNPVAGASCALANVKQVFRRADLSGMNGIRQGGEFGFAVPEERMVFYTRSCYLCFNSSGELRFARKGKVV